MKKERRKRSIVWDNCSDSDFIELVKNSKTYSEILRFFGLDHKGGNCKTVKARIEKLGIDSSHIPKGVASNQGRHFFVEKTPLINMLIDGSKYNRGSLKKRLISENVLEEKCYECGLKPLWNGKKLVLVLDHINGKNDDNRIENLRFLCPNCNSQMLTFAGRNNKRIKYLCPICGNKKLKYSKVCSQCVGITRRKIKDRPSIEQLKDDISKMPMTKVGKKYGVSDNAIRKWMNIG